MRASWRWPRRDGGLDWAEQRIGRGRGASAIDIVLRAIAGVGRQGLRRRHGRDCTCERRAGRTLDVVVTRRSQKARSERHDRESDCGSAAEENPGRGATAANERFEGYAFRAARCRAG